MTAENVINQASRPGCASVWSTGQCICLLRDYVRRCAACWLDSVFRWSMFTPLLEVRDPEGASTIRIQGSCCPCRCFSNQHFQVVISKQPQIKQVFLQVHFIQHFFGAFNHTPDCLQRWWENRHNMEEMAWLQRRAEHGPWIFWVGGCVVHLEMWLPVPHEVVPKLFLSCPPYGGQKTPPVRYFSHLFLISFFCGNEKGKSNFALTTFIVPETRGSSVILTANSTDR